MNNDLAKLQQLLFMALFALSAIAKAKPITAGAPLD